MIVCLFSLLLALRWKVADCTVQRHRKTRSCFYKRIIETNYELLTVFCVLFVQVGGRMHMCVFILCVCVPSQKSREPHLDFNEILKVRKHEL